jgi:hypothetical protein
MVLKSSMARCSRWRRTLGEEAASTKYNRLHELVLVVIPELLLQARHVAVPVWVHVVATARHCGF